MDFKKGLYKIVSKQSNEAVIELADGEHFVFKAHFPNFPLLAGFLQLEIASEIFGFEIVQIKKCKFLQKVFPNESFKLSHVESKKRVIIYKNESKVSEFEY